MSVEDNKKLVLGFFEDLCAGNEEAYLGVLADDLDWWMQGTVVVAGASFSGHKTKSDIAASFRLVFETFPAGPRLTPAGVTAEGDRVAVEARSHAEFEDGRIYENTYHFLFIVRDGKITVAKEYMDTLNAYEALSGQVLTPTE